MGLQAYREVLSKEPLSEDARQRAGQKVGRRIAAAANGRPAICGRRRGFAGIQDRRENELNAFCLPAARSWSIPACWLSPAPRQAWPW